MEFYRPDLHLRQAGDPDQLHGRSSFWTATNRPLRRADTTERHTAAGEAVQCASCLFDVLLVGLVLDEGDILFRDQVHTKQDSFNRCRGAVHYRRAGVQNAFDPVLIDPVYIDRQDL